MSGKKLITVFGATGKQGGAVVQIFLNDPKLKNEWRVRGVTRDASKPSAKKLEEQGSECVSGDTNDKASVVKAVQGSDVVYGVTNYWEKMDDKEELQQGKNIVDAAKEAKVGLLIWSSLRNVTEITSGRLKHVYHFDSKAAVEAYAREQGVPAVFFQPGMYMSGFTPAGGSLMQLPPDNTWTVALPVPANSPTPLYDPADTGKCIKAIVLNKDKLLGKRFLGATKYYTFQGVVDAFKSVFPEAGKTAVFKQLPPDVYKGILQQHGLPEFAANELKENFLLCGDVGYYNGDSLDETHSYIEDPLTTFEEFLKQDPQFKDVK